MTHSAGNRPSDPNAGAARQRRSLSRLVQRAITAGAPLLAGPLHRYASAEEIDWKDLARNLGCTEAALDQVALCYPPRADHFVADVNEIAGDAIPPDRLLGLLRQIQVLEVLRSGSAIQSAGDTSVDDNLLLAARRREAPADGGDSSPGSPSSAPEDPHGNHR